MERRNWSYVLENTDDSGGSARPFLYLLLGPVPAGGDRKKDPARRRAWCKPAMRFLCGENTGRIWDHLQNLPKGSRLLPWVLFLLCASFSNHRIPYWPREDPWEWLGWIGMPRSSVTVSCLPSNRIIFMLQLWIPTEKSRNRPMIDTWKCKNLGPSIWSSKIVSFYLQ